MHELRTLTVLQSKRSHLAHLAAVQQAKTIAQQPMSSNLLAPYDPLVAQIEVEGMMMAVVRYNPFQPGGKDQ